MSIKIYHIVHVDRLSSILADGGLLSDAVISQRTNNGSMIGLSDIKKRRLEELRLKSYPDLYVGDCVPFYFCPRSVMLHFIYCRNPGLEYQGGQEPIIHLQADFKQVIRWAKRQNPPIRWVFTNSNAGSRHFEDFNNVDDLDHQIDWQAVQAHSWKEQKERKQAEFLLENKFPWHLIEHIGVHPKYYTQVVNVLQGQQHRPQVTKEPTWYY